MRENGVTDVEQIRRYTLNELQDGEKPVGFAREREREK
jgi:hypothetical protein